MHGGNEPSGCFSALKCMAQSRQQQVHRSHVQHQFAITGICKIVCKCVRRVLTFTATESEIELVLLRMFPMCVICFYELKGMSICMCLVISRQCLHKMRLYIFIFMYAHVSIEPWPGVAAPIAMTYAYPVCRTPACDRPRALRRCRPSRADARP